MACLKLQHYPQPELKIISSKKELTSEKTTLKAHRNYLYGFNGKETDNEVKGAGNSYDFGARMYDARLGRWLSVDPLAMKIPDNTPYSFANNSPILLVDYNGEIAEKPITAGQVRDKLNDGKTAKSYSITLYIDQPEHGSPDVFSPPTNVGHAFISVTKWNEDGTVTTATFGWYPNDESGAVAEGSPYNPTAPGTLNDDSGHSYDVSISMHGLQQNQIDGVLNNVDSYQGQNYNLYDNNCVTFCASAVQGTGMNVPLTLTLIPDAIIPGQPVTFKPGLAPGQLGYDIQTGKADQQPAGGSVNKPESEQRAYNHTNTGMTYDAESNEKQRTANAAAEKEKKQE